MSITIHNIIVTDLQNICDVKHVLWFVDLATPHHTHFDDLQYHRASPENI